MEKFADWLEHRNIRDADDITPDHLQHYIDSLAKTMRPSSIVQVGTRLRIALVWLGEQGLIPVQEWPLALPPVVYRQPRHLSIDECGDLLHAARKRRKRCAYLEARDTALIALLLDSCLRKSELLGLYREDVNLAAHSVRIRAETAKSAKERVAYFTTETTALLRAYIRERDRRYPESQWFWMARGGGQLSRTALYSMITQAADCAGLTHVYPHALRHTGATEYVRSGMDVAHLRLLLGHARIETTMIYVHLAEQEDLEPQVTKIGLMHRMGNR